jgi:hypothetical protein
MPARVIELEVRGVRAAPRSQAIHLAEDLVAALGGRLAAARLVADGPTSVSALIDRDTPTGTIAVAASPGQALAAVIGLGVPLLGDAQLVSEDVLPAKPTGELAAFLESLDLHGPGDPTQ